MLITGNETDFYDVCELRHGIEKILFNFSSHNRRSTLNVFRSYLMFKKCK